MNEQDEQSIIDEYVQLAEDDPEEAGQLMYDLTCEKNRLATELHQVRQHEDELIQELLKKG